MALKVQCSFQQPRRLRAERQTSALEQQSSGKFCCLVPPIQILIGRKSNDTDTYSDQIVLIAD